MIMTADPEQWCVVQTRRYKERATAGRLARDGLSAYVPLLERWPRPAVGSDVGPMFPGYAFVRLSSLAFHRVLRTPGVRGFVCFAGVPAWLDGAVIEFLRSREGADGIIRADFPTSGQRVVIAQGPLRGLEAVLERRLPARQRVLVLLTLLQRETPIEMPERWVRQA